MTVVFAAPERLLALADALTATARALDNRVGPLQVALETFFDSGSDRAPAWSPVAGLLCQQRDLVDGLAGQVAAFAAALVLGDDESAARRQLRTDVSQPSPQTSPSPRRSERIHAEVLDRVVAALQRRVALLEMTPLPPGIGGRASRLESRNELVLLRNEMQQYRTMAHPPHRGWAGVGQESWASHASLRAAVARGHRMACELRSTPSDAPHPRTRYLVDEAARRRFTQEHPFVDAALESGVVITPGRLGVMLELDRLASAPLERFLEARATAETSYNTYDWTTDGCSGPIPADARGTCLRHDFLYRNARMLRDQWGLGSEFAERVKEFADERFGRELFETYEWYRIDPLLAAWLWGAEGAVERWGSVDAPWSPPNTDDFYGDR